MNWTKTIIFSIVLMCMCGQLFSQKHLGNFDQLLLTGSVTPTENLESFLIHPQIARDEIIQNQFYRIVQFFDIPDDFERRALMEAGITLFDYLPHLTYVAAIQKDFSNDKLRELNIRSITKLQPSQKISPAILENEKVVLQYYPNLSPNVVRDFLENKNIEIYEFLNPIHSVVICNPSDLETVANFPITFFISPADGDALPEYVPGKNNHRSNVLTPKIEGHPQYNGEGINIAIGDDGEIQSHIDFKNRLSQTNVLGDLQGTHGEMVTGILAGAGNLDPQMEGTASHANIHMMNDFETVRMADALYNEYGVKITSTSYSDGCNRGYTYLAQLADYQVRANPSLMHVFSAGNTGNEDCGYGAGEGWGNITGGVKMGKNVLTVANVNPEDQRSSSSSRGPANDGRIKPDISANGDGQISTQPNNTYAPTNGSSAAAPGVAGVLAQLYQAFYDLNENVYPNAGLIKSILLNTADDLGNPGPDFSYGFGRVNAKRALNVIENNQYLEGTLGHTNTHSHFIAVPEGTQQLKVMLYWNDVEGSTISSPALVNDLDLKVTNALGEIFLPWVLNSSPDSNLLKLPATRNIDNLNNVEQITIDMPEAGLYSFLVEGAIVAQGIQNYYLTYEFVQNDITITYPFGGEKWNGGEVERIHWDTYGTDGNFEIEVSYNNGNTWEVIGLVTGDKRSFLWQVPQVITNQTKIKINRDNKTGVCSAPFTIYETPENLHIAEVCPDLVRLEWDPVANAENYMIYKLGEKYMEVFATSNMPYFEMPIDSPTEENWYAVAALGENGLVGRRSVAVSDGMDLLNCDLGVDISIHSIATPSNSILQSCYQNPLTVSINITNTGTVMQGNIPVAYQFDNQPVVNEIYNNTIPSGVTINYEFNQKVPVSQLGNHYLKVWANQMGDQATFNDTMDFQLKVIPSTSANIPYFQHFDNFMTCEVGNICDAECPLSSGWHNDSNQLSDDADWIVHRGATVTSETGPTTDQNTNSVLGKYLYLEGSGGCTEKESNLLSPCFDLSAATQPIFSFWYHMKGADIGRLHVDLFDGLNWYYNILPTLTGEQGDDWKEVEIDLSAFATKVINIRFRGVTGAGYLTDIAIDNVALFDAHSSPYPNFKADKLSTCPQQKIQLFDNSLNVPTAWEWNFSPNTVSFVDGTSATDANPIVEFNEVGNYNITLIVSNDYGATQETKQQYISVSNGKGIPFGDSFESTLLDSEKWFTQNEDNNTTWAMTPTVGRDGEITQAIFMNNHSYNTDGEKDVIQSQIIDLTQAEKPYLRFDWAYAQFNSNFADRLEVTLSSDCGETYQHVIFDKHGEELATVDDQISSWFPQKSYEWKTAEIDLSEYVGSSISIQFINVNGFGNNLFLDNFLVYEYDDFPRATMFFYPESNTFCINKESVTFLTNSNPENEFFWTFGENASPSISSEYGPHVVEFGATGTYHIFLRVANGLGYDIAETVVKIIDEPIADFDYSLDEGLAIFTSHSTFGETFFWEFGDGTTSTEEHPMHVYEPGKTYKAILTVKNKCGQSSTDQFLIITTGANDLENNFFIDAYPNPTDDFILFNMPALNQSNVYFDIIDVRGTVITSFDLEEENGLFSHQLNTVALAQGMYFARAQVGGKIFVKRFVKTL